jgi:hypothetical protein
MRSVLTATIILQVLNINLSWPGTEIVTAIPSHALSEVIRSGTSDVHLATIILDDSATTMEAESDAVGTQNAVPQNVQRYRISPSNYFFK